MDDDLIKGGQGQSVESVCNACILFGIVAGLTIGFIIMAMIFGR